jgi:hypothetical protein
MAGIGPVGSRYSGRLSTAVASARLDRSARAASIMLNPVMVAAAAAARSGIQIRSLPSSASYPMPVPHKMAAALSSIAGMRVNAGPPYAFPGEMHVQAAGYRVVTLA